MDSVKAQVKQTRVWAWARNSWLGESVRMGRRARREFWPRARTSWLGESVTECGRCRRELWAWARISQETAPHVHQLTKSLAALPVRGPDAVDVDKETETPIFLLSTGPRTGSTLLQRILVTDPRVLIWGEPLGDMAPVCRIAEMMSDSIYPWTLEKWKNHDPTSSSIATSWIADLFPPGDDFRLALRCLFDRWLGDPARKLGFARWGFKEIRLGATEASLLFWLYPRAKFVVLSRHPYDCYRSLADSNWPFYPRYPDIRADSAAGFARVWNRLALSWSEVPSEFPCFHIKYEDLAKGKVDFRKLESWLGIEIKEDVALSVSVGGTAKRSRLSWFERLIIKREAAAGMNALDYSK